MRGAVVFGSVARGDFNDRSDIDVLVVAERIPAGAADRQLAVGSPAPGGIEAVVWTPAEWRAQLQREDPIAVEAQHDGVWLIGSPEMLDAV